MITIGIDYYPEHWDRALWEEDAARMARAGAHVVRIAEFAWSRMEPEEGRFDFAWLDEAIAVLYRHGLRVILGTPTNCAPLRLYQDHPETVQWGRDGRPTTLGIRGHRCIYSPVFRRYAGRIVEEMARRYAGRPEVFAWHDVTSRAATPYRPHLAHPRAAWAYGRCRVRLDGAPENPDDGEQVVEVLALPPTEAVDWLAVHDPDHAELVALATRMTQG